MIKIAILGAGNIANAHIEAYRFLKNAKIAAVIDNNISRAREVAKICCANYYSNIDEMVLHEGVDVIDICLPSFLHKEYIIKSFMYGMDVLCEKPIALTVEDAKNILSVKSQFNRKLMIAHCLRFSKEYIYLKNCIESKEYGELLHINFFRNVSIPKEQESTWLFDKKKSGGIVYDLHIHDVDIMYQLFGKPLDGTIYISNRFADGIFNYKKFNSHIESSWIPQKKYDFLAGYRAVFENATVSDKNGVVEVINDEKIEYVHLSSTEVVGLPEYLEMYYNEINYFLDCVRNDKDTTYCRIEDNIQVLKIINDYQER